MQFLHNTSILLVLLFFYKLLIFLLKMVFNFRINVSESYLYIMYVFICQYKNKHSAQSSEKFKSIYI